MKLYRENQKYYIEISGDREEVSEKSFFESLRRMRKLINKYRGREWVV